MYLCHCCILRHLILDFLHFVKSLNKMFQGTSRFNKSSVRQKAFAEQAKKDKEQRKSANFIKLKINAYRDAMKRAMQCGTKKLVTYNPDTLTETNITELANCYVNYINKPINMGLCKQDVLCRTVGNNLMGDRVNEGCCVQGTSDLILVPRMNPTHLPKEIITIMKVALEAGDINAIDHSFVAMQELIKPVIDEYDNEHLDLSYIRTWFPSLKRILCPLAISVFALFLSDPSLLYTIGTSIRDITSKFCIGMLNPLLGYKHIISGSWVPDMTFVKGWLTTVSLGIMQYAYDFSTRGAIITLVTGFLTNLPSTFTNIFKVGSAAKIALINILVIGLVSTSFTYFLVYKFNEYKLEVFIDMTKQIFQDCLINTESKEWIVRGVFGV